MIVPPFLTGAFGTGLLSVTGARHLRLGGPPFRLTTRIAGIFSSILRSSKLSDENAFKRSAFLVAGEPSY